MFCYKSVFIFVHFTFTPIALKHFSPWLALRKTENSEILVGRIWNLNLTWSNHRNYPRSCKQILFSLGSNKKSPSLSRFFFLASRVNYFSKWPKESGILSPENSIFFNKSLEKTKTSVWYLNFDWAVLPVICFLNYALVEGLNIGTVSQSVNSRKKYMYLIQMEKIMKSGSIH